jgi:UDP-arabinose 4-epimerase
MKILVTGGAGYIGSHICKQLAKVGLLPIVADNMAAGHHWAVKWGPLEQGDILDRKFLDAMFLKHNPSGVIHLAALSEVGVSVDEPAKYYANNVVGTLRLIEAMRAHHVNHLVFSSTCAIFGIPSVVPIGEEHPLSPINPYGASKLMSERMLADFDAAYGMRSVSLRYFNAAGADPDGEVGEDHIPETHLIPILLQAAAGKRPHVTIYGTDYDTPDGTCIRDYVHVTDLAEAHISALKVLDEGGPSSSFNLGSGRGFSVRDLVAEARRITGQQVCVKEGPRRPGDPPYLLADASRARAILKWECRHSDLPTILSTAWLWHRKAPPVTPLC